LSEPDQQQLREGLTVKELIKGKEKRIKIFMKAIEAEVHNRKSKGSVVLYADDVVYFPKSSKEDPIEVLENPSMGIIVNREKSD